MASRRLLLLCLIVATPVLAQTRPPSQPGRPPARAPTPAERTITPGQDKPEGTRVKPTCQEVKRNARYGIYFDKVEIEKLVQTVADATCRTFILPENVRGKISIVGPENGRVEVTGDQFYAAFLAALDANGLAVYQHGRFMKVVDKRAAKQSPIPTVFGSEADYTFNEQMVTRIFKVKNVEIEPLRGVLSQLVSKEGDCIPFAPDTLICNDVGSNLHRLEKIIDQLDTKASTDEVEIVQVQYAAATDVAATIQKIFETKSARPGTRPGSATVRRGRNARTPAPAAAASTTSSASNLEEAGGGPVTLSQIIPDERTNKLIIVASPAAFERITQLIREIDIPISGEGRINVHYLENASAEDIASTLQSLAQGTGSSSSRPARPATPQGQQAGAQGATTAELFSGEVKISADKATNSLVIIASQSDYRNLVRVIEKLDIPRRQVFVEAVIMEVNLDRNSEFGLSFHQGIPLNSSDGVIPALIGTNYGGSGLPPSFSLESLASFGGFLAGLQGPVIPALSKLGVNIPAFGVVLHALQQSSDVNVLSTPHLLTSDNEEAEITVGQNVPFQAGFNPTGVSSLLGANAGAASSLLGGGLSSLYAPINRQNVELKLTIKPQINESEMIRLVISEQTEEIASQDPVLGPTTSKRSAKTTVVARNQETVVIGGIMQDRTIESTSKVPILGDLPLLGHLFRDTTRRKVKTNLLLFLTPYIINDQGDFRAIFERKMQERQQFVEQFYGQVPGYDMAVDFSRKAGPLARIHQTALREEEKLENGGPGAAGEQLITPGGSPGEVRSSKRPQEGTGGEATEGVGEGAEGSGEAPPPPEPDAATGIPPPPVEDREQLEVRPPPIDEYDER